MEKNKNEGLIDYTWKVSCMDRSWFYGLGRLMDRWMGLHLVIECHNCIKNSLYIITERLEISFTNINRQNICVKT